MLITQFDLVISGSSYELKLKKTKSENWDWDHSGSPELAIWAEAV